MQENLSFRRISGVHTMGSLQVILLLTLLCSTQGALVQVIDNSVICPTDVAVFWCSGDHILNWDIRSVMSGSTTFFLTGSSTGPIGRMLGSSQIAARVTHSNGTFINATATITRAANLTQTTVTCNADTVNLNLAIPDIDLSSVQLRLTALTHTNGHFEFNFNLNPDLPITEQFVVSISPPPPSGPDIIRSSSTAVLVLQINTEYNISIHFEACPDRLYSTIVFDICVSCYRHIDETMYIYYANKTWFVCNSIECSTCPRYYSHENETLGTTYQEIAITEGNINSDGSSMGSTTIEKNITTHQGDEQMSSRGLLIIVLIPVVLLTFSLVVATIATYLLARLKIKQRKSKSSRGYQTEVEGSDITYQYLSNRQNHHYKKNNSSFGRLVYNNHKVCNSDDEYATLKHKKPQQLSNDEYSTLNNNNFSSLHNKPVQPSSEEYTTTPTHKQGCAMKKFPECGSAESKTHATSEVSNKHCSSFDATHNKTKKKKYADVDTSGQGDNLVVPDVIHLRTEYTDVNVAGQPEDKTLNLDMLLIQLNPISKDFRLFGSVAGISPEVLDKITDSCAEPYDGLVEVCDAWLDKCRREKATPTWSAVAEILSLIGKDQMSQDIMQVYVTGKLPIQVDMNSLEVQGEMMCLPAPPPIPPHRGEEMELMTVMSMTSSLLLPETTMDEPPPVPKKLYEMKEEEMEEFNNAKPALPPKVSVKDQQRKPVPVKRNKSKDDEVLP